MMIRMTCCHDLSNSAIIVSHCLPVFIVSSNQSVMLNTNIMPSLLILTGLPSSLFFMFLLLFFLLKPTSYVLTLPSSRQLSSAW